VTCVVCGSGPASEKFRKGEVEILECPGCGLAYWIPPADFRPEQTYDAAYFADASAGHGYDDYAILEASLRRTFARRLAGLPMPRAGARLLDVGAAYGFAVAEAARLGWEAWGLEISLAAARRAGEITRGRVVATDFLDPPFAAETFDVITLWDVIEHLADPQRAIGRVARLLRPGGRLVLTTGDVGSLLARLSGSRWHLYTIPEHLFFYSRQSLRILLEAHGLRVESMRAEGSIYTLGYLVERLRKTLLGGRARWSRSWPGSQTHIRVNLFDIVTVSAVRSAPGD
jgi:SAM-dependent methyltransferase